MRGNTRKPGWKGPTIREIARLAGVGEATVDRVLNNRLNVREKTRLRVAAALDKLSRDRTGQHDALDITLFSESGATFNAALAEAGLPAVVQRVVEDKKRGLVAQLLKSGSVDEAAVKSVLGEFINPWEWVN